MRQSQLFTKTLRTPPKDEVAANAILLERGGFVFKNSAGVYSYLPLGWRVISKIVAIIREEMNAIGGQELFMPALVEKKYMNATKRWDVEVGFRAHTAGEREAQFVLGWTHEEVLTAIAARYIFSYKDLPFAAYQIQTKFRNEPRAKSGLLRGKEFLMKDLYSFHVSEEDLFQYYEEVQGAYMNIFKRCGLEAVYTVAAGGDFTSQNTHEFQVFSDRGEDAVYYCPKCGYAENKEISQLASSDACTKCGGAIEEKKAIEVGNIFPLGTKYSQALGLQFADETGAKRDVVMGSYGIGISRVMGAAVEIHHDEKGIVWPETVAPYAIHVLALPGGEKEAERLYGALQGRNFDVLYDDRDATAGEKFADADLIGVPYRVVVSERTLKNISVEVKKRSEDKVEIILLEKLEKYFAQRL